MTSSIRRDAVEMDLVMIGANLDVARLSPKDSERYLNCLELMVRILPRVPTERRTPEWREACQYLKKHVPEKVTVPCSN